MGEKPDTQGISISGNLNEKTLKTIADSLWGRLWSGTNMFGNLRATAHGLVVICRFIKWAIDTAIYGNIIYELYGFSTALLREILESVTLYLIHKRRGQPKQDWNAKPAREEKRNNNLNNNVYGCIYRAGPQQQQQQQPTRAQSFPLRTIQDYFGQTIYCRRTPVSGVSREAIEGRQSRLGENI